MIIIDQFEKHKNSIEILNYLDEISKCFKVVVSCRTDYFNKTLNKKIYKNKISLDSESTDSLSVDVIKKDLIQSLIKLLEEYPLLTTRKQCQLEFAIKCIDNGTKDFIVENRDFMYQNQQNKLNLFKINFITPNYFSA